MDIDKRYEKFMKEYERICEKYQMSFVVYDAWETGSAEIVVYDKTSDLYIPQQ